MSRNSLTILVPIAQSKEVLKVFIESLFSTVRTQCTLILINDASEPSSFSYLEEIALEHPQNFQIILKHHNQPEGSVNSINEALSLKNK
ncbi:MAG: glycosyltransferase, partial [Campylobacterales bacterium]|nr:glycosyltransferase [Campylobacterales bacterium]